MDIENPIGYCAPGDVLEAKEVDSVDTSMSAGISNDIILDKITATPMEIENASKDENTMLQKGKIGLKKRKKAGKKRKAVLPTTSEMAIAAIQELKKYNGASLEDIHGYIEDHYIVDMKRRQRHLKNFLISGVEKGILEQLDGSGTAGRFMMMKEKQTAHEETAYEETAYEETAYEETAEEKFIQQLEGEEKLITKGDKLESLITDVEKLISEQLAVPRTTGRFIMKEKQTADEETAEEKFTQQLEGEEKLVTKEDKLESLITDVEKQISEQLTVSGTTGRFIMKEKQTADEETAKEKFTQQLEGVEKLVTKEDKSESESNL